MEEIWEKRREEEEESEMRPISNIDFPEYSELDDTGDAAEIFTREMQIFCVSEFIVHIN